MGQCSFCLQKIEDGARKCPHCGSFQNWRSKLSIGSTALSLLVALISVSAMAVPILVSVLRGETSDLKATLKRAERFSTYSTRTRTGMGDVYYGGLKHYLLADVLLTNRGEREALLYAASVSVRSEDETIHGQQRIDPERALIPAGASRFLALRIPLHTENVIFLPKAGWVHPDSLNPFAILDWSGTLVLETQNSKGQDVSLKLDITEKVLEGTQEKE